MCSPRWRDTSITGQTAVLCALTERNTMLFKRMGQMATQHLRRGQTGSRTEFGMYILRAVHNLEVLPGRFWWRRRTVISTHARRRSLVCAHVCIRSSSCQLVLLTACCVTPACHAVPRRPHRCSAFHALIVATSRWQLDEGHLFDGYGWPDALVACEDSQHTMSLYRGVNPTGLFLQLLSSHILRVVGSDQILALSLRHLYLVLRRHLPQQSHCLYFEQRSLAGINRSMMESCLTVMRIPKWCVICHNLDVGCPFPGSKGWYHKDGYLKTLGFYLPALALSASAGCSICAGVWRALGHYMRHHNVPKLLDNDGEDKLGKSPLWMELYEGSCPKILTIRPVVKEPLLFHASHIVLGNKLSHLPIRRPISEAGWSPESLRFIRRTLRACVEGHGACVEGHGACTSNETARPARLLHIDGETLRLVSGGLSHPVDYTALSYCWGTTEPFTTLSTNISEMREGIASSKLPQTIKDAIQLTRFLGIQHLWVDALCIIQDDKVDWAHESSKMAGIYGNAYVTIAAASASSAGQGFLHSRQPHPCREETSFPVCSHTDTPCACPRLVVRPEIKSGLHQMYTDLSSLTDPWQTRGWTLQEHLLSTRLISFSKEEVQWVCKSAATCECSGLGEYGHRGMFDPIPSLPREAAFRMWLRVVIEYSRRRLTLATDILPAISGIAQQVYQQTGSQYLAGLWIDNLQMDLRWEVRSPASQAAGTYIAPTFSWASVMTPVIYNSLRPRVFNNLELIDWDRSVKGGNSFGEVSHSWLRLRGSLMKGLIGCTRNNDEDYAYNHYLFPGVWGNSKTFVDEHLESFTYYNDKHEKIQSACRRSSLAYTNRSGDAQATPEEMSLGSPVFITAWALYLGAEVSEGGRTNNISKYLLLGRSPRDTSMYERLGVT
ncbi:heterokaryon incompatibility protein-domain-containing protein [Coniochaeta sp. 2T2.1]|nr:heterokaryon incompatibility protein-domain-containing protein [Coniochaeta sp. 2T2.1]